MKRRTPLLDMTESAPENIILGLAVAVDADGSTFRSKCAQHNIPLFGDLRWKGWAAALRLGFADRLIVIGGIERLPSEACSPDVGWTCSEEIEMRCVPRGLACCHALKTTEGVSSEKLDWRLSEGNTGGNAVTILNLLEDLGVGPQITLSSNLYHIPRAMMDLYASGVRNVACVPAEAYWVAEKVIQGTERMQIAHDLSCRLGGGPVAERLAAEAQGAADKLLGRYQPLTR